MSSDFGYSYRNEIFLNDSNSPLVLYCDPKAMVSSYHSPSPHPPPRVPAGRVGCLTVTVWCPGSRPAVSSCAPHPSDGPPRISWLTQSSRTVYSWRGPVVAQGPEGLGNSPGD